MNSLQKIPDKYSAVWVSHSSISDFLKCPRAYYLRNVYKNKAGHKITIISPALALGSVVHDVIESLSVLPVEERFKVSLVKKLDASWLKVAGKKGGFENYTVESAFRDRAIQMLINLQEDPGPLLNKAIRIKTGELGLPNYYLSPKDEIILCGKIDWLEYDEAGDMVNIIDFKTGKHEEQDGSLQLPIYLLLATNTQSKKVAGAMYWYLDRDDGIVKKKLPDMEESFNTVLEIAKEIKLARQKGEFKCTKGGCSACRNLERVVAGEGELVNTVDKRQDVYYLPN